MNNGTYQLQTISSDGAWRTMEGFEDIALAVEELNVMRENYTSDDYRLIKLLEV